MNSRLELLSARVPRYTSYPTAPHFNGSVTAKTYRNWLEETPVSAPLSLYLHIPFCDTLCWFCGCHTKIVNNYAPVSGYVDLLLREIELTAKILGTGRAVSHIHWGGGSPTILSANDIARLSTCIRKNFTVASDAEFAIEVDPRGLLDETIDALKRAGITRVSIGVQDCDEDVQNAINRIQPFSVTKDACDRFRHAGVNSINVDLVYGLPHQTEEKLERTIRSCLTLHPQRFAIFGYAHVPQFKKHQGLIPETALPSPEQRLLQYDVAQHLLNEAGYRSIGLDHFARPDDPLALAQSRDALHRNFQGYTTDTAPAMIGFGLSSIGALPQGYAQNHTEFGAYKKAILENNLPIARGIILSKDDRLRAAVIEKLMCDLTVDLDALTARFDVPVDYFAGEMEDLIPLACQGLVVLTGNTVAVPDRWRIAVRVICAVFDAYLTKQSPHAIAV